MITWRNITLAPDEDGVYRPTAPVGFPISLEEGEECWLAAVGGGRRVHVGGTAEEALDLAVLNTIEKADVEAGRWTELASRIREVVG